VRLTGDRPILQEQVGSLTMSQRLEAALRFLLANRWDVQHGLVWSAVTVDWGDVQAGSGNAVIFSPDSKRADGIYANAMLHQAVGDYLTLPGVDRSYWTGQQAALDRNIRRWLWDDQAHKYRAHVYLEGSPFPAAFDETQVTVHGGTAQAALAGLLSPVQLRLALARLDADVSAAHAGSIGLTVWPYYPGVSFHVPNGFMDPGSYQNGGDWDWFGARMVQALIASGDIVDAYRELRPMVARVVSAGGFYEWWDATNQPHGSPGYRGAAGELGLAILQLQGWAASRPAGD
jgi:hypothetical protein